MSTLRVVFCTAAFLACGGQERRSFQTGDQQRLREPFHASLSPDGRRTAYYAGDSLWVTRADEPPTPLAAGGATQHAANRPFAAWAPDSRRFFARLRDPLVEQHPLLGRFAVFDAETASVQSEIPPSELRRIVPMHGADLADFGEARNGGPRWSPDGRAIAFLGWVREPAPLPDLQVFSFDVESREVRQLTSDRIGKTSFTWHPSGDLLFTTRRAEAAPASLYRLTVAGDVQRILEFPAVDLAGDLLLSRDGSRLWVRTGSRGMVVRLESGEASVERDGVPARGYVGWGSGGLELVYDESDGMARHLGSVDIETARVRSLTAGPDVHRAEAVAQAADGVRILFSRENGHTPADLWSIDLRSDDALAGGSEHRRWTRANPWLDSVFLARSEVVEWEGGDGTLLQAQILLPEGGAPHPLLIQPYGGYTNAFPDLNYFLTRETATLVGRGWAVVRPNTRGVAAEAQAVGYGAVQLDDTEALIRHLAETGLVDPDRAVVMGHSHGAAMALYYLTHSESFRAGIAVNGPADWISQAALRRMTGLPGAMGGMPEDLPEVYARASPLANVDRLTVPLLIVSGARDEQIPPRMLLPLADSLRARGRDVQVLRFEDEGHILFDESNIAELWAAIFALLDEIVPEEGGS